MKLFLLCCFWARIEGMSSVFDKSPFCLGVALCFADTKKSLHDLVAMWTWSVLCRASRFRRIEGASFCPCRPASIF
ncbi:hypothetical protein B0H65DRAFT_269859 [Neurospora tetraspora]|uniref:Secreted protein n=1 Tax=Neurospora tetraspora TaxID=94610 RepID=A0AAE0JB24_9PEZI|nr:hypothetical protein B0H65DRAFT_269859 [Neurospora tetraspora]